MRIATWTATWAVRSFAFLALAFPLQIAWAAKPIVPGTGEKIDAVGDDFEAEDWAYEPNNPKASSNIDKDARWPTGEAKNGRVFESAYRGHPDVVKRVPTPPEGLPESKGALLMQTLRSGVPGRISNQMQQDDFMVGVESIMGGRIPPEWTPSAVVRVYLPPFEKWEKRTGPSLGIRLDLNAYTTKQKKGFFSSGTYTELEPYWPGFFICLNSKADGYPEDSAYLLLRSDRYGQDFRGPDIKELGWWTFGMSVTPDGQVHYYASPGADDLTEKDYLGSQFPYSFQAHRFNLMFFNVVNQDNGRNWSTPWIVDDPSFYFVRPAGATARKPTDRAGLVR